METEIAVKEKPLTREDRVARLEEQSQIHADRAKEFERQLKELIRAKRQGHALDDQEVIKTLQSTAPGQSVKHVADRILQIPLRSDAQLDANIRKIQRALEHETLMERKYRGQIKTIEREIHFERLDAQIKTVFISFENWLNTYRSARQQFYNELNPEILKASDLDPKFFQRAMELGYNKSMCVSIGSHFRPDMVVNMEETVEKILNLSDAYTPGQPLLEKTQITNAYPDDPESFFGFKDSISKQ